jgi:hypothetical protein
MESEATTQQRAAQAGLTILLERDLQSVLPTLQPTDLKKSLPQLIRSMFPIINRFSRANNALTVNHYNQLRREAGIKSNFVISPASPPNLDQVTAEVKWATRSIWGTAEDDLELDPIYSELTAISEAMVLNTGRDTVTGAVAQDKKARGWVREVKPGACSFCLMLATRTQGPLYTSEDKALFKGESTDKYHSLCRCLAVPVFGTFEPTAHMREVTALYIESTRGVHGSKNMQAAFRKAVAEKYGTEAN